jgi:hypothetical protein
MQGSLIQQRFKYFHNEHEKLPNAASKTSNSWNNLRVPRWRGSKSKRSGKMPESHYASCLFISSKIYVNMIIRIKNVLLVKVTVLLNYR